MKPSLASSGAEALSAIRKADSTNSFDLVLLDVHMPDMDGFAVAAQIRNSYKQQGLKVILLTSGSGPAMLRAVVSWEYPIISANRSSSPNSLTQS